MRAVCSGTDGIGCCGQSDMAKPPEITAPTPLSTLRLTHSPTVSDPKWDSSNLHRETALNLEDVRIREVGMMSILKHLRGAFVIACGALVLITDAGPLATPAL